MGPCATHPSTGPRWCTGGTSSRSSTGTSTPKRCSACCPPASRWRRWTAARGWGSSRSSSASGSRGCRRSRGCPGSPRRTCAPTSAARTGRGGIWFFSLDAARLGAVVTARATYRLPYFWSEMSIERSATTISYRCRRRWPGPRGARSDAVIEIGDPFRPEELTELDHFLTARWALFSAPRSGLRHALAVHEPWPLHRARVVDLHDELVAAAGLPQPTGEPLVHYSPTVAVRIGWPSRIDRV